MTVRNSRINGKRVCDECQKEEATQVKQTYGRFLFYCDRCFECEETMTEQDMKAFFKGRDDAAGAK